MHSRVPLATLCGQLIVGGFEGESVTPRFAKALRAGKRGGAILFKRNLPTSRHARMLTREIVDSSHRDFPPFLGVDEEGGRVSRLGSPVLRLPPMRKLAAAGDLDLLERAGHLLGAQLAALGFNLDFAPVLDVDTNPENPIIGDRAFGSTPDAVSLAALSFYQGLSASVLGCGKHFPGHGDTLLDSHLDLPLVEHPKERLWAIELMPFAAAARSNIDALMTAHVIVNALDEGVPATLSRKICTELLRGELKFQGVLFSDDLEMKAVADRFPVEESAVRAIEAGCDALLICRDEDTQDRAHEALVQHAEKDEAFRDRCREAFVRCQNARRRRVATPCENDAEVDRVMALSRELEGEIERKLAR